MLEAPRTQVLTGPPAGAADAGRTRVLDPVRTSVLAPEPTRVLPGGPPADPVVPGPPARAAPRRASRRPDRRDPWLPPAASSRAVGAAVGPGPAETARPLWGAVGGSLALGALLVALLAALVPGAAALGVVGGQVLLHTVSRARWAVTRRRAALGPRWGDVPVAVLTSPFHLLAGLRDLLGGLLRAVPLAAVAAVLTWVVAAAVRLTAQLAGTPLSPDGLAALADGSARATGPSALAAAVGVLVLARVGLSGRRRAPARAYLRADLARLLTPPVQAAAVLAALALACLVAASAAAPLVLTAG